MFQRHAPSWLELSAETPALQNTRQHPPNGERADGDDRLEICPTQLQPQYSRRKRGLPRDRFECLCICREGFVMLIGSNLVGWIGRKRNLAFLTASTWVQLALGQEIRSRIWRAGGDRRDGRRNQPSRHGARRARRQGIRGRMIRQPRPAPYLSFQLGFAPGNGSAVAS